MFRKMLVCTDLTPASEALIHCVEMLKSIGTEEVILTHVIHVANTPGFDDSVAAEAGPALEVQKRMLEQKGLKVALEMPFGLPARTLSEKAEEHDVSAILIGSHGKGIIQAATLGSVSAKLLHLTRRPLILARMDVLKEGTSEMVCGRMFSRILFATDFSATAERALDYLGKIALETRCPVTLMHVIGGKDHDLATAQQREQDASYLLEAKKRRLKTLGAAEVDIELLHGKAADEILSRTKDGTYSLVVMGVQGKGFLKDLLPGSTANEVARHAVVPLLFIPAED